MKTFLYANYATFNALASSIKPQYLIGGALQTPDSNQKGCCYKYFANRSRGCVYLIPMRVTTELDPALHRGDVVPLEYSADHAEAMTMMAREALSIASDVNVLSLPEFTEVDDKYPPLPSGAGRLVHPYRTYEDGWSETSENGGMGIRFPNPEYPGGINRNVIMHLPGYSSDVAMLPFELHEVTRMAQRSARYSRDLLSAQSIDPDKLSVLTRVILYPRTTIRQNSEGEIPVALKSHADKEAWTVTAFETGPGFEYFDAAKNCFVQPESGNYLFAAGKAGVPPCKHRVNQQLINNSKPYANLDPALRDQLDASPFARLAIIEFYKQSSS